ncbi:light-sensor protein kinase [Penicillium argentinense]|uniref:Light-sensor protein kinase n=1 Tax=Penicillium argentinense TaxID=1131581 RepID=A0A9W9EJ82_9EURO|nr:light-sensor protein kinase [Penicillium argentinense]KAJ5082792.1 light-sensor protein kinase [Penicillium argentinense]
MLVDSGSGISKTNREILFQELEQISAEDSYSGFDNQGNTQDKQTAKTVLGLGLAPTARIVHNMHEQLSVKPEEGKGSQTKVINDYT